MNEEIFIDERSKIPWEVRFEIKALIQTFTEKTRIICGISGNYLDIPKIGGGLEREQLKPLPFHSDYEIAYNEERDILLIKNLKLWPRQTHE